MSLFIIPEEIFAHEQVKLMNLPMGSVGNWSYTITKDGIQLQTGTFPNHAVNIEPPITLTEIGNNILNVIASFQIHRINRNFNIIVSINTIPTFEMIENNYIISLHMENITDVPIIHSETFTVNGIEHHTEYINIPANTTHIETINLGTLSLGINTIIIGGKTYIIDKLVNTSLLLNPISSKIFSIGSNITEVIDLTLNVTNLGTVAHEYTTNATITSNPSVHTLSLIPTITHTLAPLENKDFIHALTHNNAGRVTIFTININEQSVITTPMYGIKLLPKIISLIPNNIAPNQIAIATIETTNIRPTTETANIHVRKDGVVIHTKTLTLAPGATSIDTFEVSSTEIGQYAIGTIYNSIRLNVHGIQLSNLIIDPLQVAPGANVNIQATATNITELTITETFDLLIDGTVEASQEITLTPGATTTLEFNVSRTDTKVYDVLLGILFGQFTVLEMPDIVGTSVSVTPDAPPIIELTETVTINTVYTNQGGMEGTHESIIFVNGVEEHRETIVLGAGASTTVSFVYTPATHGIHAVSVGTPHAYLNTTFEVFLPAEFTVTDLHIAPSEVLPNEQVFISANVNNIGQIEGTFTATLLIDGIYEACTTVTLLGGATQPIQFMVTRETPSTYNILLHDQVGTFKILAPAEFITTNLHVTPTLVNPDETVTVSAIITNIGEVSGTHTAIFGVNNVQEQTFDIPLMPTESGTVTFTTLRYDSATYTVNINGQTGTFRVRDRGLIELSNERVMRMDWHKVKVLVDAKNIGELTGGGTLEFMHKGHTIATEFLTLAPDETTTVYIIVEETELGVHRLDMLLVETGQTLFVEFEIPQPPPCPKERAINTKEDAEALNGLSIGNHIHEKRTTARIIAKARIYEKI